MYAKPNLKSRSILLSLGLLVNLLSGCSLLEPYKLPLTQGNVMTQESVSLLQVGLNKNQVRFLLGPPMGENTFDPLHWEYIYYSTNNKPHKNSEKHLIINFGHDQLIKDWQISLIRPTLKQDNTWLNLGWF